MPDAEIIFTDIGLSLYRQICYGLGHVLNDICASFWFTYLLVFFNSVLSFDPWQAGILMLVGQIADAIATPFVGYCVDQTDESWLCRFGKRKAWHFIGTIMVLGTFPFIFSHCIGCENTHKSAQLVYYSAFIVIFQFGWAAVQVSHLSLIPQLTEDSAARVKLSAIRFGFTIISNLFVYILTLAVLQYTKTNDNQKIGPDDADKFNYIVLTCLAVGVPVVMIFHFAIKETTYDNQVSQQPPTLQYYLDILKSRAFYLTAVVYMSSRLVVNVSQAILPLYAHIALQLNAVGVAAVPLAFLGGSLAGSALARLQPKRPFHRTAQVIASLIVIAAVIWLRFGYGQLYDAYFVFCVAAMLGIGGGCMLVGGVALVGEMSGARGAAASLYGAMSFTDKLANGAVIAIIQHFASGGGHWFYRDALLYVMVPAAVVTILALYFLPRTPEDEDLAINSSESTPLIR